MLQTPMSIEELEKMAAVIRCDIIEMICTAAAGHPGGSLSSADIVTALYFRIMRIDPEDPGWPERDRFILSKGHACPVWYAALAERGYFDKAHLATLKSNYTSRHYDPPGQAMRLAQLTTTLIHAQFQPMHR